MEKKQNKIKLEKTSQQQKILNKKIGQDDLSEILQI